MTSRRIRHFHRSPSAGPLDDDDLLAEILLRLPPQPSSLPRASLVCKRWRLLVSDRGFFRRFRLRHRRNPPLLGFFDIYNNLSFVSTLEAPNRVPPGRFSLPRGDGDNFLSLGCRHGLVLILDEPRKQILVWDPVTGDQHRLDMPPEIAVHAAKTMINGAVLRDAGDAQHFQVVLTVAVNVDKLHKRALACIYSSETGLWADLISTPLPSTVPHSIPTRVYMGRPAVLVGDSLYWMLVGNFAGILEFNLEKQSLAVIHYPVHMLEDDHYSFWIMRAEGGGLGLLFPANNGLQLWKRKTDCDGVASWGLERTIELDKLLAPNGKGSQTILGFAEENNAVFVWVDGILFMVNLESLQFKKLFENKRFFETNILARFHPFESVYTAETDIGGEHDGDDLLKSTFLVRYAILMYWLRRYLGLHSGV